MKIVGAGLGLLLLGLTGCTSADAVYRGLYEGLGAREDLVNPPSHVSRPDRRPAYWEYDAERKRLLNE